MELILDSDFVIALERERRRKEDGPAKIFLRNHREDRFWITFTVAGELACGQSASARSEWRRLCRPFGLIGWSPETSWTYGVLYRELQARGTLIGSNDLWIAATALTRSLPLVSGNHREFQRVPRLQILTWKKER